jgi:two-component system chemotaxis sensor kinase CheA
VNQDPALETFFAECRERLGVMETVLLACEQAQAAPDAIDELFRGAHTIKGSAGLFGLEAIVAFTHVVESVLDQIRAQHLPIRPDVAGVLLECCDQIERLVVDSIESPQAESPTLHAAGEALLERLLTATGFAVAGRGKAAAGAATDSGAGAAPLAPAGLVQFHISVLFGPDILRNGLDPLSFIRYLTTFGEIGALRIVGDALPVAAQFDPQTCYIGFEIDFRTDAELARIESAFEFVRDDSRLEITRHAAPVVAPPTSAWQAPDAKVLDPKAAEAKAHEGRSVRVDGDKLDRLIDLIGELVIAGAATSLIARQARLLQLTESSAQLAQIVEDVRDQALKLRMVPIEATFTKFQRVVRDVARETGKAIRLEISGAETELDRTLVEGIADPLTHLVRNSVDHGIERPEIRAERGKDTQGVVRLNAFHDAGSVVIEVSDDGGGLNRARIQQKAIERGLIGAGQTLTDAAVYGLIFEPGFSTADKVTNLSGRGVGMDVVKRNITALRGTVEIDSVEGKGTRVRIRLPLTLAIIDGFQVGVGHSNFVIPLDLVEECVDFDAGARPDSGDQALNINLRGTVLPLVHLRQLFDIGGEPGRRQSIVVVHWAGKRVGIVVDELIGELQAVIKPLSRLFNGLRGIGGSTILGSGKVALILDVVGLVDRCLAAVAETRVPAGARAAAQAPRPETEEASDEQHFVRL